MFWPFFFTFLCSSICCGLFVFVCVEFLFCFLTVVLFTCFYGFPGTIYTTGHSNVSSVPLPTLHWFRFPGVTYNNFAPVPKRGWKFISHVTFHECPPIGTRTILKFLPWRISCLNRGHESRFEVKLQRKELRCRRRKWKQNEYETINMCKNKCLWKIVLKNIWRKLCLMTIRAKIR